MTPTAGVIGIDPGTRASGYVRLDCNGHVLDSQVLANEAVLSRLRDVPHAQHVLLAIEWVSSYGMAVGAEVFETCSWVGRFQQAWHAPDAVVRIPRVKVKVALCHSARANDPNVRQALLDLYPPLGGGSTPQIGTAKKRGPLYGVHSHCWSALAVAVVALSRAAADSAGALRPAAFMPETLLHDEDVAPARTARPRAGADAPVMF